ncbi:MAG: D-glycerate dehydrogenase [Myxococcota bacterium]
MTRALPGRALERLSRAACVELWPGPGAPEPAQLRQGAAGAAGLLCVLSDGIDAALLEASPDLRVVSSCSVGLDHVDLAAARARGIAVGHTPGVLAETTADLTFGLLLAAARRIAEADRFVRRGDWVPGRGWDPELLLGRDVHGATLGIVGLGEIGRAVARRAAGFGMRVLGWSRSGRSVDGVETAPFGRLLEEADFVTLHLASTPETTNLIDAEALARLRPGAFLVNTSRGDIVDEAALVDALRTGQLAGAGLDVYSREPLPVTSALVEMDNVVLAPHIGSASLATRARMAELAVDNLLAGLEGRPLPHPAPGAPG